MPYHLYSSEKAYIHVEEEDLLFTSMHKMFVLGQNDP